MIKTTGIILFLGLLANIDAKAQNEDNIWMLSRQFLKKTPGYGINFNQGVADTFTVQKRLQFFDTNASTCDSSGNLLFYTNGVYIANKKNDSLLNCKDFNPGTLTDEYGDEGLPFSQGAVVLPYPGRVNQYLIFYITSEPIDAHGHLDVQPLHLSYSVVDMSLDKGRGGIPDTEKNIHIIEDTLTQGRITACKHANGRDWWVIIHKYYSDQYYKVLVTPDTIAVSNQHIGHVFTSNDIGGMAAFSPDGSKYVQLNINDTLDLLHFDRCSGEFSSFQSITIPDTGKNSVSYGCSFSPSSRFLYVSTLVSLYQFDTWASDIQSSMKEIASWYHKSIFSDEFFLHQIAPDGKIYLSTFDGYTYLHVINNPDLEDTACDFVQSGFELPQTQNNFSVPNFPNYDLGPEIGSGCDSIVTSISNQQLVQNNFKLNPNPASTYFNIMYQTDANATLQITDLFGRKVMSAILYPYFKNRIFYTADLIEGMYVVTFKSKEGEVSKKLIIVK